MLLADNHVTDIKIVISKNASPEEKHAVHELRQFLRAVSDTTFPLADDGGPLTGPAIIIGSAANPNKHIDFDCSGLGNEGFRITISGGRITIAGNKPRGAMYGVYGFLEDYVGIRFYTKDFTYIPKRQTLCVPDGIDDTQIPVLEYRDPYYGQNFDPDWHLRNKSNTTMSRLEIMHGGKMEYAGFVHTFNWLVPVEEYFDDHPEYFSMINGERVKERTQLCLTNPDVLKIAVAGVRRWLNEYPDANIVSVSQNDWTNACECPECAAIDAAEGARSGSLLYFVNRVAEDIERDYPNLIIDTLAYQYTRKPPKHIRPRKNVAVRLCSIECCFAHPLSECTVNASFSKRSWTQSDFNTFDADLRGWAQICGRLHIWDYVTNFAHYLSPFPNFKVLKPNIKYFIANNVTGIFEEGNTAGDQAVELNHLRQYLLAKLLWNPDLDVERIAGEFVNIYFGGAAQAILEYIDLIHKQITPDTHMGIYDSPKSAYYPESMIKQADMLFDRAETLADDEQILHRVKLCRLSVYYLKMARMPLGAKRDAAVDFIVDNAARYGVTQIRESRGLKEWRGYLKTHEI